MRRSALAEAGPLLDPTAVETERRVVWLRVDAVPILAAGQSLPHPNPEPTAFYTALGVFAALAALAVFWIYTRPATRSFVLGTIALDVAAFTALAFLSGGAFSPAWLAFFFVPLSVAFRVRPALTAFAGAAVLVAFLSQALAHPTAGGRDASLLIGQRAAYLAWVSLAAALLAAALERRTRRVVELAAAREELHARYRQLFETVPIGLYRLDGDRQIVDLNPAAVQLLGSPGPAAALSLSIDSLFVDRSAFRRWRELAEEDRLRGFEFELRRLDGGAVWVRTTGHAVKAEDGRTLYYEGSLEDVSELRRAQEALTMARQRLMVDSLAAEQRERKLLAENLHDHAIQNLLSARHELEEAAETSPHPALERADRALADTVAELREAIFELHPYVLEEAGLEAALRAAAERAERLGGFRVRCDLRYPRRHPHEDVLYSAARQLLANAAEHSGARAVGVQLSQRRDEIVLAVEDDGQGFDAGILPERVAEGHVGLASQRERIESVGGRLELRSSPGHGTKVTVSVPGAAVPLAVPARSLDPQTRR
jgi:PAS domain S-box-containing protein